MKQSQLIQLNDGGILMPDGGVARGTYFASHNEGPWEPIFNSLTKEYLTYLLNSGMRGSPAALTSWYMTLFGVGQNQQTTGQRPRLRRLMLKTKAQPKGT